jgi:RNA polymerase sigma-70 factor (ECF subfamily)
MAASLSIPRSACIEHDAPLEFDAVYRRHFAGAWRVLRRLGVAQAHLDDAAQDVFLVVHKKLAHLEAGAPLRRWILAIAVRVASEYRRRARRKPTEPLDDAIVDPGPGPGRASEVKEWLRLLHALLEELDERKREVFVLSELEQLSAPEIADVLGANVNTVYARLRAARKQFAAGLVRHRSRLGEFS